MTGPSFAPHQALAARLLPMLEDVADGSHDGAHLARVWGNVAAIQAEEGGDLELLAACCVLHDCVAVEKNSPQRAQASRLSAARATPALRDLGWPEARVAQASHVIAAHSFSAGIEPETLEARILQDADRLDALGAIGVARCFYTAGRMGSALYDPADPLAQARPYDDVRYALDHFGTKLLHLASGFRTATGARMAQERHDRMARFVAEMTAEAGG